MQMIPSPGHKDTMTSMNFRTELLRPLCCQWAHLVQLCLEQGLWCGASARTDLTRVLALQAGCQDVVSHSLAWRRLTPLLTVRN
eukprot:g12058.t1